MMTPLDTACLLSSSDRNTWGGDSFMAIEMEDSVLGEPAMMALRNVIKGCPEQMKIAEAGHVC
ncbi:MULTISPECIES: hypothetical protein [Vibrio]|uniref:hypothetical protein n=1 Tax=Vibrio TaxID=662 RepID=UPI00128B23E4|nr:MULTISPECIES: hypothetical protein [Vibrio]MPW35758.1 hypothetical protein [Vibrio sp. B1Z05]